jgi:hypothetical protein
MSVSAHAAATMSLKPGNFTQKDSNLNRLFILGSAWSCSRRGSDLSSPRRGV